MKNLKKTAAVLTAAALTMSMGISAYAENDITGIGESASQNVIGTYVESTGAETVYRVDITWGSMAFTYTEGEAGSWNPETHRYNTGGEGAWSGSSDIKVVNHSNAGIYADVKFAKNDAVTGAITGKFSGSNTDNEIRLTLSNAASVSFGNFAAAPSQETTLTLEGNPGKFENGTIGTVTVAISDTE